MVWEQWSERQQTHNENIASDLIYEEVLIQANIANDGVRNFQHRW